MKLVRLNTGDEQVFLPARRASDKLQLRAPQPESGGQHFQQRGVGLAFFGSLCDRNLESSVLYPANRVFPRPRLGLHRQKNALAS